MFFVFICLEEFDYNLPLLPKYSYCLRKCPPPAIRLSEWLKNRVHAAFFDFADLGHELTEATFWEGTLFEPEQVFLGQIKDWHAVRWIFFFSKHPKRHGGAVDFQQEVAEIFVVDFGNFKFQISSFN